MIEMAFFGEYEISVTDGGRIVLPKKIRENLKGTTFILTKGFDVCLAGYDRHDWETRSQEFVNVSLVDTTEIDKRRMLFSGANEIETDEQGRFVIPKALLQFIGLSDLTVVVIGVGDHFEIWEKEKWKKYLA
jgi:MraZ protein